MSSRCLAWCPAHSRELVDILLIILRVAGYLSSSLFGVWLETDSRAHWSFCDWRYLLLRVKYRLFPLILRELSVTTNTIVIFLSENKWRWAGRWLSCCGCQREKQERKQLGPWVANEKTGDQGASCPRLWAPWGQGDYLIHLYNIHAYNIESARNRCSRTVFAFFKVT